LEKRLVWLAMVTSADNAGWPCDIAIDVLSDAGLPAPSIIRPWKLATVDASRIVRVAGRIAPASLSRLMSEIANGLKT
jgi:mRNA interferase MazF